MTVSEFKKQFPEFAHLEGDALWNKMEDTALANSKPATEQDMEKFFAPTKHPSKRPMESYRMLFIDTTEYNNEN